MSAGEFKEDEFSVGMFLFACAVGPLTLVFLLYTLITDVATEPARRKSNEEFRAKQEAQRQKRAEEERKAKEEKKSKALAFISSQLPRLKAETESAQHDDPLTFLADVSRLGAFARSLTLSEITDEDKRSVVEIIRYARINASSLSVAAPEKDQVKLVNTLSGELTKLTKKYKKSLEAS